MITPQPFVIDQPATRVVFGPNSRDSVAAELEALGAQRVLVTTTVRGAEELDDAYFGRPPS